MNSARPVKMMSPKIMLAIETLLFASFGGNKKVRSTTEMHFELFTMFISTKLTPQTMLRFVRNKPKKTMNDVTITSLSNRMTLMVYSSWFLYFGEFLESSVE